eukprot:1140548-Pelagomonas_calceolata.AAC.2
MACLVEGMGSVDSPTHTQKDCVKSDLSTLKLFAQFAVLLLPPAVSIFMLQLSCPRRQARFASAKMPPQVGAAIY